MTPSDDPELLVERAKLRDKLSGGLTGMGFKTREVNKTLEELFAHKWAAQPLPPIEELTREALWALTPR